MTMICKSNLNIDGWGARKWVGWAAALLCLPGFALVSLPLAAQEPTPNTFVDWPVPRLTQWNDVNLRTVTDPDTPLLNTRHTQRRFSRDEDPADITFIYPDQATRDADVDEDGTGSVAFISWALDDGSGRAPGLQVVTDDFAFPTNNCVMASGERESEEFPGTIVPKTCSDPQGSSKRWFLEVTEADVPIDLVFDTGLKDIRYKGVKDPVDDGGEAFEAFRQEFGIGRIYRVLGKFLNLTGKRIVSMDVQVGTGVGDDFVPLDFENDGIAFELRQLVPREFFEGETGAPDIAVWSPMRFASMAPKLFDDGARPRFDPGFFADATAGLIPPQSTEPSDQSQFIDSGTAIQASGTVGAMTPNHFDIPNNQGATAVPPLVGSVFGYLLPDEKAPFVIARHDDGDPTTESDALVAWWDGFNYRYGQAGGPDPTDPEDIGPYGIVPNEQLQQWAALPLGLEPTLTPDPARYEFLLSDDHANLNTDIYLHISETIVDNIDNPSQPRFDNITLRFTGKSVESLGLGEIPGSEDPEWLAPGNEAPPLLTFAPENGEPVAINDLAATFVDELVNVDVLANDLLDGALVDPSMSVVDIVGDPANGTAEVVLPNQTVDYTPEAGFIGEDTFTYTVTVGGVLSNVATAKIIVNPSPIPDAPIAANDSAVTFQSSSVAIDVLANDTISDGPIPPGAVLEVVDQPVNGLATATVSGDQIVYDPSGTPPETLDVFTYRVTVEGVPSNVALVTVRVDADQDVIFTDRFETEELAVFKPDISGVDANIDIEVRAAQDASRLALQFSWPTNKNYAGLFHRIRALDEFGEWNGPLLGISDDDPFRLNEDRVSIIFGTENGDPLALESEYFGCFQSCHADMSGMTQDNDASHYVIPENAAQIGTYQSDMWHWRGSRAGPMGFAEDTWIRAHDFGTAGQGRQRDVAGPDGDLRQIQNFETEYNVTVDGQPLTVKLPSWVYEPALNSGFYFHNDGGQLITEDTIGNLFSSHSIGKMEADLLQHQLIINGDRANALAVADLDATALNEVARQALAGGIINRQFLADDTSGTSDQHDIPATRRFSNDRWTVTMIRDLNTDSPLDTDLSMLDLQNYPMAFAVHDSNDRFLSHHVSVPFTLGAAGDIEPTEVPNLDDVNWLAVQPLVTTLFKPGNNMSFEWLNDNPGGHPVPVDATCSSCHSLASVDHPNQARPPGSCLGCHTGGGRAALVWEYAPLDQ